MRKTNKQMLLSVVSLFLCFAMLLGSTYAWFTDLAVSKSNIIKTGTLDVEMYWADGSEAIPTENSEWEDASSGAIFTHKRWEPGYVEVRHIKIDNVGSLAFKYKVVIVANGTVTDLTDAIDVYYFDPAVQVADRTQLTDVNKLGTLTQVLANLAESGEGILKKGESDTITIALKMREDAGNNFMNKSLGSTFSVQVIATQTPEETDGFGDGYDSNVEYPNVSAPVIIPETVVDDVVFDMDDVKVTVPAEIIDVIPAGVTSVSLAYTNPVVNATTSEITYSSVELIDQNGKVIDLSENTVCDITVKLPANGLADGTEVKIYHDDEFVANAVVVDGYITYTAAHFCEIKIVPIVPEVEHIPGDVVIENEVKADCTNAGSYDKVIYCTDCGEEISRETVTVPATGHTAGNEVIENNVASDCANNGSYDKVVYCTVCGEEISRETVTVDAPGHIEETIPAVAPTCTQTGLTEGKKCSVCGEVTLCKLLLRKLRPDGTYHRSQRGNTYY